MLLLTCAALLGSGTLARADVLVSNLEQSTSGFLQITFFAVAQGFTTGSNSAGYILTSVEVGFGLVSGMVSVDNLTVVLRPESSGAPGTDGVTLINPPSLSAHSAATFTAPAGTTLSASTKYYVVLSYTDSESNRQVQLVPTNFSQEDSAQSGWDIDYGHLYRAAGTSDDWSSLLELALRIKVNGTQPTQPTQPDAPTDLEATSGDGSVTLSWNAPFSNGGSAVTGHQYRQKTTGAFGGWQDIALSAAGGVNATSYTVTFLTNGTAYTFEVQARNDEDDSGPSNQASATPVAGDTTAPMLQGATTTALELKLTYDENLDAGSEPAPTAFTVTVDDVTRAVTGVSASSTNVLLTLASAVRAGETVTVSYAMPAMNPLRDEASNPAAPFAGHPVTNETPATAPDAPTGLEATPGDESVTLRWNAPAYDGGSDITSHQYRRKTTGSYGDWQNIPMSAPGGANAGSFTVSSGLTNGTTYTFQVQAVNMEGGSAESNEARATPVAGDTTAPMLQGATTTAMELKLTYDENLDADSEPGPTAFTVTVNDATRAVTGVSASSTNVFLTLASAVRAGETVTVSYTVPAMNPLRDEASIPAAPFADHPVTNETPATAPDAPTGLEATPGDESVTLRWTASAHDGGSAVTSHQYRQKTTGAFGGWQNIALSAAHETNAGSFTVSSELTNGTTYTFEVRAVNAAEGGSAESNEARATPVAGDSTAPMLQGATTTAMELKLTYDENLDADSEPAPSAFTVTVNDATRAVTGVSASSTNVFLTLASAVRAGETVTVSYTVPAMNPLRDEASNPAASFSDQPVMNETPATAPDAPSNLEATPGDGSVTLSWTAPYDGGSAITGHQYCREEGTAASCTAESDWQDIAESAPGGANATAYTVTKLTNGRDTPSGCGRGTRRARAARPTRRAPPRTVPTPPHRSLCGR